ncbi:hypothetical protein V1512DRAFT_264609 [Lipomyces arxii]|uniref:uncharacterized protein n=1 Tax=Lipomyces arxii TaxID=56418 RepID=UPI0034CEC4DB
MRVVVKTLSTVGVFVGLIESSPINGTAGYAFILIFLFIGIAVVVSAVIDGLYAVCRRKIEIYDSSHVMLNIASQLSTWNNMGLWTHTAEFVPAAIALATKLSDAVQLQLSDDLLDIGIGCGDQAKVYAPLSKSYVGITSLAAQADMARSALASADCANNAKIWTLDASDPATWPEEILLSVGSPNKIIALDCLYHFSPSRARFLAFAHDILERTHDTKKCHVAFAAEDLLRGPNLSRIHSLALNVICKLSHSPAVNFVTQHDYATLLHNAGFTPDSGWTVTFEHVSDSVFPGLCEFIARRSSDKGVGKYLTFSKYTTFGKLVSWWHANDIIRAYVITLTKQ